MTNLHCAVLVSRLYHSLYTCTQNIYAYTHCTDAQSQPQEYSKYICASHLFSVPGSRAAVQRLRSMDAMRGLRVSLVPPPECIDLCLRVKVRASVRHYHPLKLRSSGYEFGLGVPQAPSSCV